MVDDARSAPVRSRRRNNSHSILARTRLHSYGRGCQTNTAPTRARRGVCVDLGQNHVQPDVAGASAKGEAEFFDAWAVEHGDFNPFTNHGWQTLARRFFEMVPLRMPIEMLDVGCGTGHSRAVYADRFQRYTGLDLSWQSIVLARQRHPSDEWLQGDASSLPFSKDSFDVVCFSSVLHHLPDRQAALVEAFRVLRPGGSVFAFDPNLLHPAMALFRWPKSPLYNSEGVSPNESPLLPRTLRRDFQQACFQEIRQRCQSDIPYRAVAPKRLNALLHLHNRIDAWWESLGLGRFFGVFVLTTGRKPG
jgi:ubiquinone/menaquinone biosynthesis C-methylase UbiE